MSCKQDWINLYRARQYTADVKRKQNDNSERYDGGNEDPFTEGWAESEKEEEKEKHSNPFLNLERKDIDAWRTSIAEHILKSEDGALASLPRVDAIARYRAIGMLKAYYRFDTCLQCPKWLERTEAGDMRADALLRHLVALFVGLGERVPVGLRNWARDALLVNRRGSPGRPNKNWRRDQKITLAVDTLVELTHSSVDNAERIVLDVCREKHNLHMEVGSIKKIRDRVKREAKQRWTGRH